MADEEAYKFVDDASFLEVINLLSVGLASLNAKNHVASDVPPEMAFLPPKNAETQQILDKMSKWTKDQKMVLSGEKSKYMIVNFCNSLKFKTRLTINDSLLQQVRETRLLGVVIQDDLSWKSNTQQLVKRAYARMIILRKLVEFNIPIPDMINIYVLFVRSLIEQSSVVWSSSLTKDEMASLERTQKVALRIVFHKDYISYENALQMAKLQTIQQRYRDLLLKFALKCSENDKTRDMLPLAKNYPGTRNFEKFEVILARKQRLYDSAIPTMARMLNKHYNDKR